MERHVDRLVREYELLGAAQLHALDDYSAETQVRKGRRCGEVAWERLACHNEMVRALEGR